MTSNKRNRKNKEGEISHSNSINTEINDPAIKEMAELSVASLKDNKHNETDFDEYAKLLRSRIFQDIKAFTQRFIKGYKVLIETLSEKKDL